MFHRLLPLKCPSHVPMLKNTSLLFMAATTTTTKMIKIVSMTTRRIQGLRLWSRWAMSFPRTGEVEGSSCSSSFTDSWATKLASSSSPPTFTISCQHGLLLPIPYTPKSIHVTSLGTRLEKQRKHLVSGKTSFFASPRDVDCSFDSLIG